MFHCVIYLIQYRIYGDKDTVSLGKKEKLPIF